MNAASVTMTHTTMALEKSNGSVRAVAAISFEVAAGEIFGVVGPNRAGKTVFLDELTKRWTAAARRRT